jgi:hypothetical protein
MLYIKYVVSIWTHAGVEAIEDIDYSNFMGKRTPNMANHLMSLAHYVTWRHFWCTFWINQYGQLQLNADCQFQSSVGDS